MGLDIDHASQVLDLDSLETKGLPLPPANVAHDHALD